MNGNRVADLGGL